MPRTGLAWLLVGLLGLALGGCMQATLAPPSDASLIPKDGSCWPMRLTRRRAFRSNIARISSTIRTRNGRGRSWSIPTRVTSTTCCRAARRSAMAWPWGRKRWRFPASLRSAAWRNRRIRIPTPEIQARLGPYPPRIAGGPANPLGARALYLYAGNKDTLYRIHGTNQPEYIGQAISSGCIRMTNEDVIDLFDRVKQGATVVVLAPGQSGWSGSTAARRG